MNDAAFGKSMENVRNHRDIKLITVEARSNCLVSEANYYTTIFFQKIHSNRNKKNTDTHE